MELLVAILIIALIAAGVYIVLQQRRRGAGGLPRAGRARDSPLGRPGRGMGRHDPMADAVAEHAQATDPADVVAAEQRLRAQARRVSAGLQSGSPGAYPTDGNGYAGATGDQVSGTAMPDPTLGGTIDPATGERTDGYRDEADDPRLQDRKYDGRLAADYDPHADEQR